MSSTKKSGLLAQDRSQGVIPDSESMITQIPGDVKQKTPIEDILDTGAVTTSALVGSIRRYFPGFDKTLLSKVRNHIRYGVTLRREAYEAIFQDFPFLEDATEMEPMSIQPVPVAKNGRGGDRHRIKTRVAARITADRIKLLQKLVKEDGFPSVTAWLIWQINRYIRAKEKEAKRNETA